MLGKLKKDSLAKKLAELARAEDIWKADVLGQAKIPWADLAVSLLYQIIRNISVFCFVVPNFHCVTLFYFNLVSLR